MLSDFRCARCSKLLGKVSGSGHYLVQIKCPRCGFVCEKENKLNVVVPLKQSVKNAA